MKRPREGWRGEAWFLVGEALTLVSWGVGGAEEKVQRVLQRGSAATLQRRLDLRYGIVLTPSERWESWVNPKICRVVGHVEERKMYDIICRRCRVVLRPNR